MATIPAYLGRSPEADRDAALESVVRFVAQMHAIPTKAATAAGIGPSDTNRNAGRWRTFHADLTTTLYPLLMRHQRDYVNDLFVPVLDGALAFDHRPTLVYGDDATLNRARFWCATLDLQLTLLGLRNPVWDSAGRKEKPPGLGPGSFPSSHGGSPCPWYGTDGTIDGVTRFGCSGARARTRIAPVPWQTNVASAYPQCARRSPVSRSTP